MSIRVLMFGWEFPPHISGGLGTACKGLVEALLKENVSLMFVVPMGEQELRDNFQLVSASEVTMSRTTRRIADNFFKIPIPSALVPYESPESFAITKKVKLQHEKTTRKRFSFKGGYTNDLYEEVANYATVATQLAIDHKKSIDIIHAHDWLAFPAGLAAKKISGKPLVVHVHATEYDRSGENINPHVFACERDGMIGADHIIAVSDFTKQIIVSRYDIPPEKVTVIHNGIQLQEVKPAMRYVNNKIVTFLGRITFQKGPTYFVEAAYRVLQKLPDVQFVMAGNGDKLEEVIRLVAHLRIGSHFHFTGFLKGDDVDRMFSQSDVYVMPSVSEPFGISPLEAIQAGVPVIISKQSGVSEVLKNAIKVDFWNVDAVADAIFNILTRQPLSRMLKDHARSEVRTITWNEAAAKVKKVYNRLQPFTR